MAVKAKRNGPARILITINVVGSAGPIRFVVNEDESVSAVINTALRCYAREGRLPVLGSDANNFLLYWHCAYSGYQALSPWELIGSSGSRKFELCKKKPEVTTTVQAPENSLIGRNGSWNWKAWINKSLGFIIPSH